MGRDFDDDSPQVCGEFTVHVVDDDEEPVKGARVAVSYGFWHGISSSRRTDEDGNAEFHILRRARTGEGVTATIYVDGDEVAEEYVEDGASVTVHAR